MDGDEDCGGPGGICDDCGHFAATHRGEGCAWPGRVCPCRGMLWLGVRYEIDSWRGPVRRLDGDGQRRRVD